MIRGTVLMNNPIVSRQIPAFPFNPPSIHANNKNDLFEYWSYLLISSKLGPCFTKTNNC